MQYAFIALFVLVFVVVILRTGKRNGDIRRNGIETEAVVSRIREDEHTDTDGSYSGSSYAYFVTYRTADGQTVEARLGNGKSLDVQIGKHAWNHDLQEGTPVRIKYLPDKPEYVIRVNE